jgi:hypothetical protein
MGEIKELSYPSSDGRDKGNSLFPPSGDCVIITRRGNVL